MSAMTASGMLPRTRRSARLRLTLLYGGLFLVLGTALLLVIFVLTARQGTIEVSSAVPAPAGASGVQSVRIAPVLRGAHNIVVAQHSADTSRLLAISWVVLAVTALGAVLLGWFAAGRFLRPLREITSTARTISAGNLHERLALTGPDDEFRQLGDTLDDLLGRLEASFEAQRHFVANASHELRTPMTVERTLLQVALADPDATTTSLRAACQELLESQVEHERLLEGLLTLASSERGLERREPLDLAELARQVMPAPVPDLTIEANLEPAPTSGDPALVRRLIGNLVENAVDHNDRGGSVAISTGTADGEAVLSVINTGPEIPAGEMARLLEPFQRLQGGRSGVGGHFGLGLSIARAIALAHDAELDAEPRPGGGLAVTVRFELA
ncbi:MAG TPA: ATP-binding protein [Solirubrobacteraceae bacterium]|nr:ATP-binding protein [Solirubrobacteraceae bacterium]